MDTFLKRKKDILSKLDKSSKGGWDKKIAKLCEEINKLENYYTTSSCAGRVVILIDEKRKVNDLFLKVYHGLVGFKKLKNDLNKVNFSEFVKFKQEPPILHVVCRDLEYAQKLVDKARLAGWKRSGIITTGKRCVVELMSTEKLEFLIMNNNRFLVNNEFLELIVKRSNENLKDGWEKIERLRKVV